MDEILDAARRFIDELLLRLDTAMNENPNRANWYAHDHQLLQTARRRLENPFSVAGTIKVRMDYEVQRYADDEYGAGGGSHTFRRLEISGDKVVLSGGRNTSDGQAASSNSDEFEIELSANGTTKNVELLSKWLEVMASKNETSGPYVSDS